MNSLKRALVVQLMLAALVVAGCEQPLSEDELLGRAEAALAAGDAAAAEVDIKNALKQNPESGAARRMYGEVFLWQINPLAAVDEFERSLRGREDPETRLLLAKALVQAGESARLIEDYEAGRFVSLEGNPEIKAALARAYLAQVDPETGAALLAGIAARDNEYVNITRAVYALQTEQDIDGARELLLGVTESDPRNAHAWSLLGVIANTQNETALASEYFGNAADINPNRLGDRLERVNALLREGKSRAAAEKLASLERLIPKYPEVNFMRGQLLYDEGRFKEAIDAFALVLQAQPTHLGALLLSGNANMQVGNETSATRQLEDFLSLRPGHLQAGLQLARLTLQAGDPVKAEGVARATLDSNPEDPAALELLAASLAAQGLHRESAALYEQIAQLRPDSTEALVALGVQQFVAGDQGDAVARLEEAVARNPGSAQARERLIEARLAMGERDMALADAEAYVDSAPESTRAKIMLGRVHLLREDFDAAREQFQAVLALEPGDPIASGGMAALAVLNQDLDGAQAAFETALEENPGDLMSGMNLALIQEQSGDGDAMAATLRATADANPEALAPRLALARLAMRDERPADAIGLLTPLRESSARDYRLWQVLTGAYVMAEQPELAQQSLKQLLELRPDDPAALALAAEVSARAGRAKDAQDYLERALAAQPESVPLRQMLVQALMRQNKFGEAGEQLAFLPEEVLEQPAMLPVRGRLALIDGDAAAARPMLEEAFAAAPGTGNLALLTAAKWMLGEQDAAVAGMQAWLNDNPGDAAIRADLAQRELQRGNEDAARTQYRALLDLQPESALALNNLAWLLRESDPDAALRMIERADTLVGNSAQIKDTYAMIELGRGNTQRALNLIERAVELAPDMPEIQLNRARILIQAGRVTEARQVLQKLAEDETAAVSNEAGALLADL